MPDNSPCFDQYMNITPEQEESFNPVEWGWVGKNGLP